MSAAQACECPRAAEARYGAPIDTQASRCRAGLSNYASVLFLIDVMPAATQWLARPSTLIAI
jgi:hypothetical protein